MADNRDLPKWVVAWLWITSIICIWDGSFIICRPHSLPGGSLHTLWKPYALYIEIDHAYKDMGDTFGIAQAFCNIMEVIFNFVVLYFNSKRDKRTYLLAFMVTVMTWWKTVIYILQYLPICDGGHFIKTTGLFEMVFLFFIPNGIWILMPSLVLKNTWSYLSQRLVGDKKKTG